MVERTVRRVSILALMACLLIVPFWSAIATVAGFAAPDGGARAGDLARHQDSDDDDADDDDDDDDDDPTVDRFRADQAIVRLAPGADVAAFNSRHGASVIADIASRGIYLLRLPDSVDEEDLADTLEDDPAAVWAELNFTSQAPEGRPGYFFTSGGADAGAYNGQYASDLLGLPAAHDCARGDGVVVAVIDTGIDAAHPVFAGRVLATGWNVFEQNGNVADVGNGIDDDGDGFVDEMVGHGTHVAGTIVLTAPGASILPVKALDSDGGGDAFFLAAAIYYAIDHGARVINLSLGSTHDAIVTEEAVADAAGRGIIVTAAAGNLNRFEPEEYPASGGVALGVAATDAQDLKSAFSNFHPALAVSAPGTGIASTVPGGGYATWSGTSMATPFVSGAAALLLSQNPGWSAAEVNAQLQATAVDVDGANPSFVGLLGAGRLDVVAAVDCPTVAAADEVASPTAEPTATLAASPTAEPTATIEPTPTIEPTTPPEPTATVTEEADDDDDESDDSEDSEESDD
ncbi:MAG: S8 family serine peptidase [Thermomicrobiales bacterium]